MGYTEREREFVHECNRVRVKDEKKLVIGLRVQDRLTHPTKGIDFAYCWQPLSHTHIIHVHLYLSPKRSVSKVIHETRSSIRYELWSCLILSPLITHSKLTPTSHGHLPCCRTGASQTHFQNDIIIFAMSLNFSFQSYYGVIRLINAYIAQNTGFEKNDN